MVSLLGGTRKESKLAVQAHLKKLRTTNPAAAAEFEKAWDLSQKICPEIPSFLGTCEKGGRLARVYSTRGVSALALSHHHLPHPSTFLRIPHDVGGSGQGFTDATWMHDDASIRLTDDLAVLYVHEDGSCVFDHAPEVLGLTLTSPDGGPGSKEKKS